MSAIPEFLARRPGSGSKTDSLFGLHPTAGLYHYPRPLPLAWEYQGLPMRRAFLLTSPPPGACVTAHWFSKIYRRIHLPGYRNLGIGEIRLSG